MIALRIGVMLLYVHVALCIQLCKYFYFLEGVFKQPTEAKILFYIIPHNSEIYLGMAMLKKEGARAMAVVRPELTSL